MARHDDASCAVFAAFRGSLQEIVSADEHQVWGRSTGGKVDLLAFTVVSPLTLVGAYYGARKTGELDSTTLTRWIAYALIPTAMVMLAEVVLAV